MSSFGIVHELGKAPNAVLCSTLPCRRRTRAPAGRAVKHKR